MLSAGHLPFVDDPTLADIWSIVNHPALALISSSARFRFVDYSNLAEIDKRVKTPKKTEKH